jgi:ABC-type transport system substrate-binding protein
MRDFASDAVQHQTFDWLYRLVCALAGEGPLCLVLDDLQWSDEATLSLLDELLPSAEQAAVVFVLIHRSDPDHSAWQLIDRARRRFRRFFCDLELEPLPDDDAHALAEAEAGEKLQDQLARLLAERAGGNPYFVGEAIRDLRERGALARENDHVVLVGEAPIPAAIQEALQARLGRLDADARELLTTAAVIGRSFSLPLLERLLPGTRLRPILSELQWLRLVVEERAGAAPEYRFRHGLVQEVAYGSLREARRRELHLRVGEALESIHRDSPAEAYGLLARHFAEADEPERAVEYLMKASDAARAVYANEEAIKLYRRALAFMERTGDDARARQTLLKIALTYHLAFDYHAANEALGEAFAKRAPALQRLEPSERITLATPSGWPDEEVAPGLNVSDMANWVTRNLFRGLVAIVRDLDIEPDLAERFTVSDDGRSYRFTLRSDARWSDGAPVTADDFEFTFARMVEDDVASASWLEGVSARAVSSRILEIRLDEPRSHFLYLLGQAALFAWPRHIYERRGRDWYRDVPLVGSGPFVLTRRLTPSARSPGRMTIESAPAWYGARGNVSQVAIELEPSPPDAGDRWRAGEYHVIYDFIANHAGLSADEETVVQQAPAGYTDYLGLDARRAPLDDVRVRRALAHAIDRHGLSQALGGTAAATGGMLPPAMPGHSHRIAPAFDPDRARALLSEAGHPGGRGLGEIVLAHFRIEEETACVIASQLAAVGVRVRSLPANSYDSLLAAIKERAHAYVWAHDYKFPDPGGGFLEPFLRWGPWLYRDDRLEQLLNRATAVRDQGERLRTCREFERIWIGEQTAVVPLAYNNRKLWRRPWVTGMWVNAISTSTFADAVVRRADSGREADALEHAETA